MPAVFISYSRRDKDFVERLHEALSARQYDVWVDWQDIPPVAQWFEEIQEGLGKADGFVYVISPDSVDSEVCTRELEHAVEQHKRIVPIVRRNPGTVAVPEAAAELNWIFLREGDDFNAGLDALVGAIEQDLDHVRTHTRLGVAANHWNVAGRDRSQLLRGSELAAAESWLVAGTDKEPGATHLQREFVLASRQAATRRQRSAIAAVTLALVVTAVLAVVALIERSSAISARTVAYSRQLDADAQSRYPTDPELSVLLAVQAARVDPDATTEENLRAALAQSNVRVRYSLVPPGDQPQAGDALWSPDGTRLLVTSPAEAGFAGWARIYRPASDAAPVTLQDAAPADAGQSGWDARGDRVVIGGGQPAVYDARTGRRIARIPGTALFAALNSDGTRVVTVDLAFVGHVYDVATGRQLASFHPRFRGGVTCMALSPDGQVVAQCDVKSRSITASPAELDTWSVSSGRLLHSTQSTSLIGTVAFDPTGSEYVFTSPVGAISSNVAHEVAEAGLPGTFVYDTASGRLVKQFQGPASAAVFSPNAALPEVVYATFDDLAHVYSFLSGVNDPLIGSTDTINSLSFNQIGSEIVVGSRDGTARVYNAGIGGLPVETLAGHESHVLSASFGLDGTAIATSSDDGTVRVWASPVPTPSASLPPSELGGESDALTANMSFTSDSRRILQVSDTGRGQVLDADGLKVVARFQAPAGQGFAGAGVGRDGRVVAALSGPFAPGRAGKVFLLAAITGAELYDATTGRLIAQLHPVGGGGLLSGALNRAGDRLVTVGVDGSSDVWNTQTGRLAYHIAGSTPAGAATFSQDGSQLAIVHYPTLPRTVTYSTTWGPITIDLYNTHTGRLRRRIVGNRLTPQEADTALYAPLTVAFSPDGKLLAVSGAVEGVVIYSTASGAVVRRLGLTGGSGGSWVASLAFSPNGKLLAMGSVSGTYVWSVPSWRPFPDTYQQIAAGSTAGYVGGGYGVNVTFTDNSQYLLTSGDSTVDLWDLNDLMLFHATARHGAISPNSSQIVTASVAGVAEYPCALCGGLHHLLALATTRTTRTFTPAERATYLQQG